jgi:hypothetical protein
MYHQRFQTQPWIHGIVTILFTYSNDTGLAFVTVVIHGRPAFRTEELVIFIEDLERKLTCARHRIAYYKMISYLALP